MMCERILQRLNLFNTEKEGLILRAQRKSFGIALLLWFVLGSLGAHRMYIHERIHYIFWYWFAVMCTFSIILWIDLFRLKGMIDRQYYYERGKYVV